MNPRVKKVKALSDYILEVIFENGEKGFFSMLPYLDYPVFSSLKDYTLFKEAKASMGFITWKGEIDMDPDTVYLEAKIS